MITICAYIYKLSSLDRKKVSGLKKDLKNIKQIHEKKKKKKRL